jgi:hypothetical protein
MKASHSCRLLVTFGFSLLAVSALGQTQTAKPFEPQVGQQGKDVVWVPTPQAVVDKMLDMAKVTPQDYVIDLGSGDGRTVITAAKRGARAHGIEYDPNMVELSKRNAASAGVDDKTTFEKADLFESDFSKATVVSMFLLPSINMRLRPKLLELTPGTRVVSNSFTMEDWQPDETAKVENGCVQWCTALLWIVPAKVEGTWRLPHGELTLKQQFQMLSGTLTNGASPTPISDAKMRGDQIVFSAGGVQYTGRVNGNTLEGTTSRGSAGWRATRSGTSRRADEVCFHGVDRYFGLQTAPVRSRCSLSLHAKRDERIDPSRTASREERGCKPSHREYHQHPCIGRRIVRLDLEKKSSYELRKTPGGYQADGKTAHHVMQRTSENGQEDRRG